MKKGYEHLYQPLNNYEIVFKYAGTYHNLRYLNKITTNWNQSRSTKSRVAKDPSRWDEAARLYGVEFFAAAPLYDKHLILTNGDVLFRDSYTLVCDNGLSVVKFIDNGDYFDLFRANIVYKKFVNPNFDLIKDQLFYLDGNMNNPDISNLLMKDAALAGKKKPKPKQHWADKVKEYGKYD